MAYRPLLLLLPLVPLLGLLFSPCLSIFEDQYIGNVKHATFQTQSAGRERVVVATEQNVVASLNLRKGEIFWKHVLGDSDKIDGLDIALGKYVITLSEGGRTIRAWHLPDGQLVWETSLQSPGFSPVLQVTSVDLHSGRAKIILVFGSNLLHGISSADGKLLWTSNTLIARYLNKNVLFVATVAPRGSGTIGEASPEETWLVAYIVDTVTGHILHRVKHPSMHGPVHAVFSENWVVYHYFNLRAHRFEISVLEIYDKNRVDNKNVLQVMLGRHNASAPVSFFSHVDLDVKTQSYFFTHSVKALTVTATARGITGKQVLVGTIGDQVLALDKRYFDPRRTVNPTPAEREDGVIPLTDSIPINPQSYLTHAYQVEGLRGIIAVPASLESTSLVFSCGVDLFYTHTAPSRTYDSLTEDFGYALLLITIVALLIAIVTTWILSERKELKEKWK